jgi:hypothetical protein
MPRLFFWLSALMLSSCATVSHASDSTFPSYPLDSLSRQLAPGGLSCAATAQALVRYEGTALKYAGPVRVHPGFRASLTAFERIVDQLAREHFGRAPRSLVHFGAYACRSVRGRAERISEHALGNALDVAGFRFGPLPKPLRDRSSLAPALQGAFQIRVLNDWNENGTNSAQSAFLRALAAKIAARPDIFRVVLGPGYPGHDNHFHLDNAPYRMVELAL